MYTIIGERAKSYIHDRKPNLYQHWKDNTEQCYAIIVSKTKQKKSDVRMQARSVRICVHVTHIEVYTLVSKDQGWWAYYFSCVSNKSWK